MCQRFLQTSFLSENAAVSILTLQNQKFPCLRNQSFTRSSGFFNKKDRVGGLGIIFLDFSIVLTRGFICLFLHEHIIVIIEMKMLCSVRVLLYEHDAVKYAYAHTRALHTASLGVLSVLK